MRNRNKRTPTPKLVFWALLPASGALVLLSGKLSEPPGAAADPVIAPLNRAGASTARSITGAIRNAGARFTPAEEIQTLRQSDAKLRSEVAYYRDKNQRQAAEIDGLRRLLKAQTSAAPRARLQESATIVEAEGIYAWTIASDTSSFRYSVLVNRGEQHGIKNAAPVASGGTLVGQVKSVHGKTSRVLLLVDPSFKVAARVLVQERSSRNRTTSPTSETVQGILYGVRPGLCTLKYIPRAAPLKAGDTVVTSGLDGQFPSGLLIGKVSRVDRRELFAEVDVEPGAAVTGLQSLQILRPLK